MVLASEPREAVHSAKPAVQFFDSTFMPPLGVALKRNFRSLIALGLTGTVVVLGLASCSAPEEANGSASTQSPSNVAPIETSSADPTATPVTTPLFWADGSQVEANVHTVDQARQAIKGEDFTEVSSSKKLVNSQMIFQAEGVESTGTLVGRYGPLQSDAQIEKTGVEIDPDQVMIGRIVDGTFVPFTVAGSPTKNHRPAGVDSLIVSDSGIIWAELDSLETPNSGWKIMQVAPGSTEARVLAAKPFRKSAPDERTFLSIREPAAFDNRVYWSFEHVNSFDNYSERKTYSVGLGKAEAFREEPLFSDTDHGRFSGTLFTGRGVLLDQFIALDKEFSETGDPVIKAYAPGKAAQEVLRLEKDPAADAMELMGGDAEGFTVFYNHDLYLVDPVTRQVELFEAPEGSTVTELAQCGERITWSYQSILGDVDSDEPTTNQYVYDRKTKELMATPVVPGLGLSYCSGEYLSFALSTPGDDRGTTWDEVTAWKN